MVKSHKIRELISRKLETRKDHHFLFIIGLINLLFFSSFLMSPYLLTSLDNDLGRTYIPLYSFIADSVRTYGQIPLWRPDQMMGDTFIGNPLSTLLYLPNLIFIFLPVQIAAVLYLFLHFLLASVSTYFLAKTFGFSKLTSFAAAIFYGFSTKMLVHLEAGHITMIAAASYLPLLFFSTRKIIKKPNFGSLILGAVALVAIYITYTTIFFYASIFIIVYIIYCLFLKTQVRNLNSKKLLLKLVPFLLMALAAAGLSAAALLPQIEYGPYSTRSQLSFADVAIPLWNLKKFIMSLIFPYLNLQTLEHESFLYLGIVPIIFGAIGFLYLKNRQKVILLIFALLTLLFVAGQSTPVFKTAYDLIPPLQYTRVTTRPWFVVALVSALLAAYGVGKIKNQKIIFLVITIFLAESFFIFTKRIQNIKSLNFDNRDIYQFLANDQDFFRVYCTTYCFNPQLLAKYRIQILAGETPIQNASFVKFLEKAGNYNYGHFAVIFPPYQVWQVQNPPIPNSELLGLASVKYVVSTYDIKDQDFEFIKKFNNLYLFENLNFRPIFSFEKGDGKITVLNYKPNTIDLSFEKTSSWRSLIISENYYPDWYAYVDDQKFPLERHNQFFKKVIIPPNSDSTKIKYQPQSLQAGKTITVATILFLVMYFWYTRSKIHD